MSKHVVIGDGIAGATAAQTLREKDPDASIDLITDEREPLYNRINIKEYAKGRMPEEPIRMHNKEWYTERDINLRLNTKVWSVDTDNKEITLHNRDNLSYDKLLVAAGGTPRLPDIPHIDADRIHTFWTFIDARKIRRDAEEAENGVVIGAGLLGIDYAYALAKNDVDGKYLMRGDRWWRYALDDEGAEIVHDELRNAGVEPVFGEGVDRFEVNKVGQVKKCIGTSGTEYPCDVAGVCIGLDLNTEILNGTDAETDTGILVDEHMQTTDPDIYAAGDITEFHDVILDETNINGSWDSAKKQGQVAALNMLEPEKPVVFDLVPKYSVSHFSMPFISLGSPTMGDTYVSQRYDDKEYRRLAFKDGSLVGAVLIGNVRPVGSLTKVIQSGEKVDDIDDVLLEEQIDLEAVK